VTTNSSPHATGVTDSATATVSTRSADETRDFAATLAAVAELGDRLALVGPLGAGKTQFAKGFAVGLGVTEVVNSPSFTLMTEYAGRVPLFHQDLYRLSGAEEAMAGGLVDERQLGGVTLTEWAERLPAEIDPERVTVSFEVLGDQDRRITVSPSHAGQARYVDAAAAWQARDSG
jgi:tRNA threonylcarbamoyladenosine biosynthesis protein TsaE